MVDDQAIDPMTLAYYLYLKGYPQAYVAAAAGVTTRTLRTWADKYGWGHDLNLVRSCIMTCALLDNLSTYVRVIDELRSAVVDPPAGPIGFKGPHYG